MPTTHLERERKFTLEDEADVPDLAEVAGVERVQRGEELVQEARYYDTADFRLARSGITLRRRTGGVDDGWHLKIPHPSEDGRDELAWPLEKADAAVPDEPRQLVTAYARTAPLVPVATLRTERSTRLLIDAAGSPLAEVTDDHVDASAPDGSRLAAFREVEVEAVNGDDGLLSAVADVLKRAGAVEGVFVPKVVRALGPVACRPPDVPEPPATVRRKLPAADLVAADIRRHVQAVLAWEAPVRLDVEDAVHKMRVSVRRLRSSLRTFAPLLEAEPVERLEPELKWLGEELGQTRDAEVVRDRLLAELDALPPASVRGPVRQRLGDELEQRYAYARRAMLTSMNEPRYLRLLEDVVGFAAAPPMTAAASDRVVVVVPALVAKSWRRLRRRVKRALDADLDQDELLHDARKKAKQARYAAEATEPAYGRKAARLAQQAEAVQDLLGEHQDAVVARALLLDLADGAHRRGDETTTYGILVGQEEQRATESKLRLPAMWKKASRKRHRRWLKK